MNKFLITVFSLTLLTVCCSASVFAQNKPAPIPKEVNDVVGTYTGSWTSYGLDATGQVVKQAAWTDTLKAADPVVEKNRAFVTTVTEMTFEGGRIPPMKVPGKEGYTLNADGSLGDYFIETFGQTYKMQKLGDNVLAYTIPATTRELARLGGANAVSAQHTLIKVVTVEQGIETHNISRLTTVRWKDASGKERTTQFVSLQGFHRKQSEMLASVSSAPPTVAPKPKVFIAVYERGAAYQKDKGIFEQPTIKEHIAHHEALSDRLIAAGPLKALPEDRIVGIIVFEAESEEAAQKWLREDPAVASKVLAASVRQWGVSGIKELRRK